MASTARSRPDRCPGVFRPWPADDGALVRIRLIGGRISSASLVALSAIAREHGDGNLHLTARANLQLRALPGDGERLRPEVVAAIEATGLVPSREHDLVRNVMVSPLTGLGGGLADLRPVAAELDTRIRASSVLAGLPGRFLFVLDDGRGDLVDTPTDLGLVALDAETCRLRIGDGLGPVTPLADAPGALVALAEEFQAVRGTGPDAAWHISELGDGLETLAGSRYGPRPSGLLDQRDPSPSRSVEVIDIPDGILTPALVDDLSARADELIVTPWHGIVVPT